MTTARPCQEDGTFLQDLPVPPTLGENNQLIHDWMAFEDRCHGCAKKDLDSAVMTTWADGILVVDFSCARLLYGR
jgi:hypothetical protein